MSLDQQSTIGSAFKLDKYELSREIAGSGVATTWAAKTSGDERSYVVLRLHRNVTKKPEAAEAFLKDAETGKLASHPNVIPVVQAGSADGEVFVVWEHFAGEALSSLITQAKTEGIPAPIALRIGRDMLEGLAAAHKANPAVPHGELNPFHMIVGKDGVTRIAGFGWAQALSKFGPHGLMKPDRLAYAAPERVKALSAATANTPSQPFDVKTDVFAAAVILWELISKQRLFASKMEAAVVQKVTTGPIGQLATQPGVKVAAALAEAIHKALERDPAKRPGSIDEMLEAIRAIADEEFAKPEDVSALVEKLAAKAPAPVAAPAAPKPAAGIARPAPAAPGAPKPVAVAEKPAAPAAEKDKDGAPASVRPKAGAPLPKAAVPARKSTLLGGVDAAIPKAPAIAKPPEKLAEGAADKPAEKAADKPAEKAADKPVAAAVKPPAPPPPRASAPPPPPPRASAPPPPPKIGMPKPPTFTAKPEAPKPPAIRPMAESIAGEEIDLAPDSSPKPGDGAADAAPVVAMPAAVPGLEKPTIPVPAMIALKEEAAAKAAAKAADNDASGDVDVPIDMDDAGGEKKEAAAEEKKPDAEEKKEEAKATGIEPAPAKTEVTITAHTPTSHPSASPREGDDAPMSRSTHKSSALDKLKPRSTLGRYEILLRVAQGGMASVWAARLQGTRGFQKIVAIKTMLPDVSDDPEFETMFLDEARVAARIRHPNVVEIFDLGEQDDVLYIVMEWVEGDTLSGIQKAAKRLGGIPQNIIVRLASQVCAGLHAAHELRNDDGQLIDLVHRDISPGNILISTSGFAKVTDFGVAKSSARLHVTRAEGMVKGKTPYLSPEQLSTLPIDRRSDLFSLGVLLYVMVTGLHPFRGDTEFKTIENIAIKDPIPPIELVPSVHPDLDKLILKALEKDRTKRFSTAAEMQRALDHVAAQLGEPITDEDVAGFVKKVIGETQAKSAADLRAAIAAADAGAAADRISITSEAPRQESKPDIAATAAAANTTGSDGREPPINVAADGAAAVAAAAAVVAPPAPANDAAPVAATPAASTLDTDADEPPKKKKGAIIGIVAGLAVAAGLAGVFLMSGGDKPVDKPSAPATTEKAPPAETQAAPPQPTPAPTPEPAPTEQPKAEEPKAEEPKAEEPKAEEPAPTAAPTTTEAPVAKSPPTYGTSKTFSGTNKTATNKTTTTTNKTTTTTNKTTKKTTKFDPTGI